jgi:hypothetical protein
MASALTSLHSTLSPEQRGQLVDQVAARFPQGRPAPAALDAFRGDAFDAQALVHTRDLGAEVSRVETRLPGLSDSQRTDLAAHLRRRAAREGAT